MMATSDMGFVSALMRVRTQAYQEGSRANNLMASARFGVRLTIKSHFFSALPDTLNTMRATGCGGSLRLGVGPKSRWTRPQRSVEKTLDTDQFAAGVKTSILYQGSAAGSDGNIPILDLSDAVRLLPQHLWPGQANAKQTSEDWRVIHNWILDRMYLDGIPIQYLIPDPSYVPPESIRFFHIDNNWMDCFIDGALSCANHTALNGEDTIRENIKSQFNRYLQTPIPKDRNNAGAGDLAPPQVPLFGFFLRSSVISMFNDLIVQVPFVDPKVEDRAPILAQRRLGTDMIMVLLDRLPDGGEIQYIKLIQPSHQQRFAAADYLGEESATMLFRMLDYGATATERFLDPTGNEIEIRRDSEIFESLADRIYDWNSRCLNFHNLEKLFFGESDALSNIAGVEDLRGHFASGTFADGIPPARKRLNSSFVALQLSDSAKYLEILPPTNSGGSRTPNRPYQIRTRPETGGHLAAQSELSAILERLHNSSDFLDILLSTEGSDDISSPTLIHGTSAIPLSPLFPDAATSSAAPPSGPAREHAPGSSAGEVMVAGASTGQLAHGTTESPGPAVTLLAANPPQLKTANYMVRIWPRGDGRPSDRDLKLGNAQIEGYVRTNVDYAADLIVSLQRVPRFIDTSKLEEVQLTIPLGPSADRAKLKTSKPGVIQGPGLAPVGGGGRRARMLSNQRWVAVLDTSPWHLIARLIPRSVSKADRVSVNKELSFMISGVETNWESQPGFAVEMGLVSRHRYDQICVCDKFCANLSALGPGRCEGGVWRRRVRGQLVSCAEAGSVNGC